MSGMILKRFFVCLTILIGFVLLAGCDPDIDDVDSMNDQDKLARIAMDHELRGDVRARAAGKINDQEMLLKLAGDTDENPDVRAKAIDRVTDQRAVIEIIVREPIPSMVRSHGLLRLKDPEILLDLALNSEDEELRKEAALKIHQPDAIKKVVLNVLNRSFPKPGDDDVLSPLVERIEDHDLLILAAQSSLRMTPSKAVAKLNQMVKESDDQQFLTKLVITPVNADLKRAAREKITDPRSLLLIDNMVYSELSDLVPGGPEPLLTAINSSPDLDEVIYIALNAKRKALKKAALDRLIGEFDQITNEEALVFIATNLFDQEIQGRALTGIKNQTLLVKAALEFPQMYEADALAKLFIPRIESMDDLAAIVGQAECNAIRKHALARINDQDLLKDIVVHNTSSLIRNNALARIQDPDFWLETAKNNDMQEVRATAKIMWMTDGRETESKNLPHRCWDDRILQADLKIILMDQALINGLGQLKFKYKTNHRFTGYVSTCLGCTNNPIWDCRVTIEIRDHQGAVLSKREYYELPMGNKYKHLDLVEICTDLIGHADEKTRLALARSTNPYLKKAAAPNESEIP